MANTTNSTFTSLIASYKEGSPKAFSRLFALMESDLKATAKHYGEINSGKGNFMDEYFQEASIALIKAVETYDAEKGSFRTYAKNCMENAVRSFLKKGQCVMGVKEGVMENISKLNKGEKALLSLGIAFPSMEELMEASGISSRKTMASALAARGALKLSSLDKTIGEGSDEDDSYLSFLCGSSSTGDDFEEEERQRALLSAIKRMEKVDRIIVVLSFGLYDYRKCTNREICRKVGLSEVSVISHRRNALRFLKEELSDWAA